MTRSNLGEPNRLCLVIPGLTLGGMERVMSELARHFCARPSLEVHLVLYGSRPEAFYELPVSLRVHRPPFRFRHALRPLSSLRTLHYLRRTLGALRPNAVLSFGEYWNSLVLLAALGLGLRVFVSDRCRPDKSLGHFHDTLRRLLYPRAQGVVAQTETAARIFKAKFPRAAVRVIGNPIRQVPPSSRSRENWILTVGRLIDTKHHDRLIRLFLKARADGWKLVIVGADAQRQNNLNRLKELVSRAGAEERVVLAGGQKDVDTFYRQSKIFAFTSSSEGFPNAVGEALSAGLPVVSYDCIAGPSEMVRDGENGFLVPVFDDSAFLGRLQRLIDDDGLREAMAHRAPTSVAAYSLECIGERFLRMMLG